MSDETIRVEIYDQIYSIRSDGGSSDYIQELASFVDSKMRDIAKGTMTVDSLKVAILAALHIADEHFQQSQTQNHLDVQLGIRSSECAERLDRLLKYRDTDPQPTQARV